MQKTHTAIDHFRKGNNCAQSVLLAFSKDLNVDPDILMNISCGFGGGMGRLQKTCGAVTGAFMALSLFAAKKTGDNESCKELSGIMIRDFYKEFVAIHGSGDCSSLLGYDLNTDEGQSFLREHGLSESVCNECIIDAVNIIERVIKIK